MQKQATPGELKVLWDAVADGAYVEDASDGHRRWAFLLDLRRDGAASPYPGMAGAIVLAEEGVGPTEAWLYGARSDLTAAWFATFTTAPAARAS